VIKRDKEVCNRGWLPDSPILRITEVNQLGDWVLQGRATTLGFPKDNRDLLQISQVQPGSLAQVKVLRDTRDTQQPQDLPAQEEFPCQGPQA
jgi:hypothetical protein